MGESLAQFNQRMSRFYDELEQDRLKALYRDLGEAAQKIADRRASADLGGDPRFSGWAPPLDTKLRFIRDGVIMSPTRSSAGPWTVAEQGRNQGNASGFSGPGINTRTGVTARTKSGGLRKVRTYSSRRRWNGRTDGKRTASEVVAEIERTTPPKVARFVATVTRKHFD